MALRPTPASRASAATVGRREPSCRRRASASRRRASVRACRLACGVAEVSDCILMSGSAGVEPRQHTLAFGDSRLGQDAALGIEHRMQQEVEVASVPRLADRTMLVGNGEVGAGDAGALGAQCRVRTPIVTETGRALAAIHAVTPITSAKPHVLSVRTNSTYCFTSPSRVRPRKGL